MKALAALLILSLSVSVQAAPVNGLAMHGTPKYGPGFKHFDYVNPDAPRGGTLSRHVTGTFNTFNNFSPKGNAAAGTGYLYDTLMVRSEDEPFTEYGLLAKSVEVAKDRSWIVFHLRPQARFSDGKPVTAEDVVFSFHILVDKGNPFYQAYYHDVADVKALDKHTVRFDFKSGDNKELPLIIGELPVLPKHYWKGKNFAEVSLTPPVGSGPYKVAKVDAGKRVVYKRRMDYWGKDLAVNRGRYNFDTLDFEYFRDDTVALEAFKGGSYNFRQENNSKLWATGYQSPALKNGDFRMENIPNSLPVGMQGFIYNLRNPLFQDRTLRKALAYAFDFQWTNKHLFYGQYKRTRSYFQNSEMAAKGLPTKAQLKLLDPWKKQLPPEVFNKEYNPPGTDGSGRIRGNLRIAQQMLQKAGYRLKGDQLYTPGGKPVHFEFLLGQDAFKRIVLPFTRNLKMLGVTVDVRRVDQNQYIERLRKFDYDMIVMTFPESTSPGNEQRNYWSSKAAKQNDSNNYIGIQSPVVDDLVNKIIAAPSRQALVTRCRALDRVLQWGYYVIPNWYIDHFRVAYGKNLRHPRNMPPYGLALDSWWSVKD